MQKELCLLMINVSFLKICRKVLAIHNLFAVVIMKKSMSDWSSAKYFDREPETATPFTKGKADIMDAAVSAFLSICFAFSLPL